MLRRSRARRGSGGSRWPRPPVPLAALLAITTIVGLAWVFTDAPFETPDSGSHFAYAQSMAQSLRLPGGAHRQAESSDQLLASYYDRSDVTPGYQAMAPPPWSRTRYEAYLRADRGARRPSRSDGGGPSTASQNPPLYYLYADIAYLIASPASGLGLVMAMRLGDVVLLLLTVVGGWLLAGETFGRRRLPQLASAGVLALLPMNVYDSTSINADALLITTWTWALWLGARVINRRARASDVAGLCAVTAAAVLTKSTSYALLPAVGFALTAGWWRRPAAERGTALLRLGPLLLIAILPILGWVALSISLSRPAVNQIGPTAPGRSFSLPNFLTYVWEFYLPRLPGMSDQRVIHGPLPLYQVWLEQGTGVFGYLDIGMPGWVYHLATAIWGTVALATVGLLTRLRRGAPRALLVFYGLALLCLLGLLHVTEYRAFIAGAGSFLQGRYLLPCVGLLGLAAGLIVARLPVALRGPACATVLAGLLVLQTLALTTDLRVFYV